ncbi:MAG: aminotransferase class I/II-fold pyridoxal phosphate-dependent enzyme [Coriobacteriales bacterium]
MTYDFTSIMQRKGHDAIALDAIGQGGMAPEAPDEGFDPIPMWVADMNFPTCPAIVDAIVRRAQHPAFGYFAPSEEYYRAIIDWQRDRNGVQGLEPAHIGYENGVLGGVVSAISAFAAPGDGVLLHSPTYIGFTHCLEGNGYRISLSPLRLDDQGVWRMDFDDMERRLAEEHIHVAVLCSPHNPCGRVWERWELERAMELFARHDCVVVSDEIWSDIVAPGRHHVPTQSVSEDARRRTVALYAPSKTFNLAGLVGSHHVIYDDYLRDRVTSQASKSHYNSMNVLSMHALVGAYSPEGRVWVDELNRTIAGSVAWACDYVDTRFEGVQVSRPQGTYMLFLDCTDWCAAHGRDIEWVERAGWRVGVGWQDGRAFHGPCHVRMNLALPLSRVQEAFRRLDEHVFNA